MVQPSLTPLLPTVVTPAGVKLHMHGAPFSVTPCSLLRVGGALELPSPVSILTLWNRMLPSQLVYDEPAP